MEEALSSWLCAVRSSASLLHCHCEESKAGRVVGREQERERGGEEVLVSCVSMKDLSQVGSCCVEEGVGGDSRRHARRTGRPAGGGRWPW